MVRKAGEQPLEYLKLTMEDLINTSVSTGGSGGEDRLTENVSLNFAKVQIEYSEQQKDGSGKPVGQDPDVSANEKYRLCTRAAPASAGAAGPCFERGAGWPDRPRRTVSARR